MPSVESFLSPRKLTANCFHAESSEDIIIHDRLQRYRATKECLSRAPIPVSKPQQHNFTVNLKYIHDASSKLHGRTNVNITNKVKKPDNPISRHEVFGRGLSQTRMTRMAVRPE